MNPISIAFYSPVRGSGVSTLLTHIFEIAPELIAGKTVLLDCDLEFPTISAFFKTNLIREKTTKVFQPLLNRSHCIICKSCAKACAFGAIQVFQNMSYVRFEPALCRACGACIHTCQYNALTESAYEIATWRHLDAGERREILEGDLWADDFFYTRALQASRDFIQEQELILIDARGGMDFISLEAMHHANLLVLVIDVTLFSPEPYRQIFKNLLAHGKKLVVVVNRSGIVPEPLRQLCVELSLPIAGCLPFNQGIPRNAVLGELMTSGKTLTKDIFSNILRNLLLNAGHRTFLPV
ncbi:MAG: 4Fe-4S dicluster domain-containing protein [Bacteroidota bacterium]